MITHHQITNFCNVLPLKLLKARIFWKTCVLKSTYSYCSYGPTKTIFLPFSMIFKDREEKNWNHHLNLMPCQWEEYKSSRSEKQDNIEGMIFMKF